MDPTTVPTENWTDLIGAVIVGPISHGIILLLGAIKKLDPETQTKEPLLNEDILKGAGILLCFGMIWMFARWFDPTMGPKAMLMAGAAAWGIASGTKLAQSVGTKVAKPTTNP